MSFIDYIPQDNIPNVVGACLFVVLLVGLSMLFHIFGFILIFGLVGLMVYLGVVYFRNNKLEDFKSKWSDQNTKSKARKIFK